MIRNNAAEGVFPNTFRTRDHRNEGEANGTDDNRERMTDGSGSDASTTGGNVVLPCSSLLVSQNLLPNLQFLIEAVHDTVDFSNDKLDTQGLELIMLFVFLAHRKLLSGGEPPLIGLLPFSYYGEMKGEVVK